MYLDHRPVFEGIRGSPRDHVFRLLRAVFPVRKGFVTVNGMDWLESDLKKSSRSTYVIKIARGKDVTKS